MLEKSSEHHNSKSHVTMLLILTLWWRGNLTYIAALHVYFMRILITMKVEGEA